MKSPLRFLLILVVISMLLASAGCRAATTEAPVVEETEEPVVEETEEPVVEETEEPVVEETEEPVVEETEEPVVEEAEPCTELWEPGMPFCESPVLAEMVAAGELPPVEERVPTNPVVGNNKNHESWYSGGGDPDDDTSLALFERGCYGGTIRSIDLDENSWSHDGGWLNQEMWIETEHLEFRPDLMHGNVFADVDVNDDATEFTITMREGMKFHNGADFDSEDVAFWWNEVILHEELTPSPPAWARTGHNPQGTPGSIEVIDQYTFKWVFDGPYGSFIGRWDMYSGYNKFTDSDFLKQIHADFADPDELAAKVEEQGFEEGEWTRLWGYYLNDNNGHITGVPRYHAWISESNEATYRKMCRNPYYWKIDRWGQQLPYIDCVEQQTVIDSDAAAVELIAGNVDFIRRAVTAANLPLYTQYAEDGGYEVFIMNQHAGLGEVFLNLTYQDDMWQKYVGDFRFREALNLALDREFINESVYFGLHEMPVRWVPTVEFNPEEAIRIFEEEFGMTEMDADGCRLGEDGEPFKIPFEMAEYTGEEIPVGEVVSGLWTDVGICSTVKQVDAQLFEELSDVNENRAFTWWAHYPRWPLHEDNDYVGIAWKKTYAPLWVNWWNYNRGGGKELDPDATDLLTIGVEPPADYVRLRELQLELWATSFKDLDTWNGIWDEMKAIIKRNLFIMAIVDPTRGPIMFNADIGNNLDTEDAFTVPAAWQAEWWYYKSQCE